jgi:hypothetical protein
MSAVDFFISQITNLLGTGAEPAVYKFGVVLTAIFVLAITILESGTRRSS